MGFFELVDKPDESALSDYYADIYYQAGSGPYRTSYSAQELKVIRQRIALRAHRARFLLGTDKSGRLLDVGCGEGFVLSAFAEDGWEVAGIDYSRAGVEGINPQMAKYVEQGNLFSMLDLRIRTDERYDLVWLGNVLEHVLDPVALLQALKKLVAPGGLLVVVVPNDGSDYHQRLLADGAIPEPFWIAVPDHISYFTQDSLRRTAAATGWAVKDLQGDFPIDIFLSHEGSNYVADPKKGPAAHAARLQFETLIGQAGEEAANSFYSALADIGLGRNLIAYMAAEARDDGQ